MTQEAVNIKNMKNEKTLKQLEDIIFSKNFEKLSRKQIRKILNERRYLINKSFEFTSTNRLKIRQINSVFFDRMVQTYENVKKIKADLQALVKQGNDLYKEFIIEGKIIIEPFDDDKTLPIFERIFWHIEDFWSITAWDDMPMDTLDEELMTDINWQENLLSSANTYICYATHKFIVDGHVLSLQDMINLKPEEIKIFTEIHI